MPQADLDYYLHLYSINRLSDGGVVKIPFRLADVDFKHEKNNIEISSKLAFEYKPKFSSFYLNSNSPEEFSIDLRELYLTWYFDNSEFSIGKQIHTWGSVDQNSPIDNASPYDYYYIFSIGTEQKMGSFSGAYNYYLDSGTLGSGTLGSGTLGFVFSPIHHTNRLPLGDDDFPIELPIIPGEELMMDIDNELEFGAYYKHSFDKGDVTLSYYKGNDRVYNLSGINVFTNEANISTQIDTVFSYRQTDIIGFGSSLIHDNFALRFDYGVFKTKDPNLDVQRVRQDKLDGPTSTANLWDHIYIQYLYNQEYDDGELFTDALNGTYGYGEYFTDENGNEEWDEGEDFIDAGNGNGFWDQGEEFIDDPNVPKLVTHAFQEVVHYNQATFQFEYFDDSQSFVLGLFEHHIAKYSANYLAAVDIPGVEADVDPKDYFYPGMGAPLAILTKKALMYQYKRNLNSNLELALKGVHDLNNSGYLSEIGLIFNALDDLKMHMYLNKIVGDDTQDSDYRFNQMEDFSHFRLELEYFF